MNRLNPRSDLLQSAAGVAIAPGLPPSPEPGFSSVSLFPVPSGVWGSQVEPTEATAPIRITRRELRPDSGGAGQFRGGLGQHIEMISSAGEDYLVFLSVERVRFAAEGRHGGRPGAKGRIRIGEHGEDLPSKGEFRVPGDQPLILETPGGGGFGAPDTRDAQAVRRDVAHGLVSEAAARAEYGWEAET